MILRVRTIDREEHRRFLATRASASFLQLPSWGEVKNEWRSESLGWEDADGTLVGTALVLYRKLPGLGRHLAYLPEGPVIGWDGDTLESWLAPMVAHLRASGAFGVTMGPPIAVRRWEAGTVKAAIAEGSARRLDDLPPDGTCPQAAGVACALRSLGWRPPRESGGFAAGQPRYVFQLPLAGRTDEDLLAGFNQLWRRNIKKAAKAGVVVAPGGAGDLGAFHAVYTETAARDGFVPRPLSYFRRMWAALSAEDPERIRLYLARHEGDVVAATTMVRVGEHAWYSYGASTSVKREVRGSNAVQWQMMRDARDAGAAVYDLRGIGATLHPADPLFGLVQFKLGTGGRVVEQLGEWSLPLNRVLFRAFELYLARR